MTDITHSNGAAGALSLPADYIAKLRSGIAQSRATTQVGAGKPLLRLLKDAHWVFGQKDEPVEAGSIWAVNPRSIGHGYVCWTNNPNDAKNSMIGEVMVAVHEDKPARPAAIDGWEFQEQRMFELKCMNGAHEGQEVLYKNNSIGGINASQELLGQIEKQLGEHPEFPCPVLELLNDSYPHKKYGKVITPVFEVVNWASMDGRLQFDDDEPETVAAAPPPPPRPAPAAVRPSGRAAAPAPAPAPARVRRTAATPPPAPVEPEPTARRRPVRR